MNKEKITKIYQLSFLSMEKINILIDIAENRAYEKIDKLKKNIEESGIDCAINYDSAISKEVNDEIGVYVSPSWNCDFPGKRYKTVKQLHKVVFGYGIRNNLSEVYPIINAKYRKDSISINADLRHYTANNWNIVELKRFVNGRYDYEITEDLKELIEKVKVIYDNFLKP